MRLLLDEDIWSRRIARPLERRGHTVGRPTPPALTDPEVLALAARDERILVTGNSRDFAPLARAWAEAGQTHSGLILVWTLRSNEFARIVAAISIALERYPRQSQWKGVVVSI